jgi:uncharacterized protein YjdB
LPRAVISLVALLGAAACGGGDAGPTTPPDTTPASISLSSSVPIVLTSGNTATVSASVRNKSGTVLSATVTWSSSDAAVAAVSGGTITAARAGTASITATAGSASAFVVVTVGAGAAAQLGIRTQPVGAVIGFALATQPVVEIRDAAGNLVAASSAPVTAAIATGGGTLGGTATVNAAGGVATFSGLTVSGTAGQRTFIFTSTGLAPATSTEFAMTPPPTPIIAVDKSTVAFSTPRGTNPTAATINISNAGALPLAGMTLDPVAYDSNQPTGWLTATLNTPIAPAVVTLAVNVAGLAEGTYHATLRINGPGAPNTPVAVGVTLTVFAGYTATYGSALEKVKILDLAGSFTPMVSVLDPDGVPLPGIPRTFTSRATSVATVAADGRITAVAAGEAWVVLGTPLSSDSIFVIVPGSATGPLLRTNVTTWSARVADTIFVTVFLDPRGTPVGAASLAVSIAVVPVTAVIIIPAGPPTPVVSLAGSTFRISVGAATGITSAVPVLSLKIIGRTSGTTGFLSLTALDVSAVDGTDLTPLTTSTRLPIVIK